MKNSFHVIFIFCLLLTQLPVAYGQKNAPGKVVIHSDPRLLLLKRPRHVETAPGATSGSKHKGELLALNNTARPGGVPATVAPPSGAKAIAAPAKTVAAEPENDKTAPDATGTPGKESVPEKEIANAPEPAPAAEPVVPEPRILHPTPWPVHKNAGPAVTTQGYRVQIYNGPERKKALEIKTDFQLRFPNTRSYLLYIAPSFRVRVGNFRNRGDAAILLKQLKPTYSPIMIVPDKIMIGGL